MVIIVAIAHKIPTIMAPTPIVCLKRSETAMFLNLVSALSVECFKNVVQIFVEIRIKTRTYYGHNTAINEAIEQSESASPKIKYFLIEFVIDSINHSNSIFILEMNN